MQDSIPGTGSQQVKGSRLRSRQKTGMRAGGDLVYTYPKMGEMQRVRTEARGEADQKIPPD